MKTDKVFTPSYVKPNSIKEYFANYEHYKKIQEGNLNSINFKGYHFEDNANISFDSLDLFYIRRSITSSIDMGIDTGLFSLEQKNVNKYNGIRYGVSLFWNNFHFRLGKNDYDDFNEVVPYISYSNNYEQHNYLLEYTHQNALFYTYALCPYEERIDTDHFSISDYITFKNKTDLWMNLQVNIFSNNDINYITQFDWRFFYDTVYNKLQYDIALEGWYSMHTLNNNCFYSPTFTDATLLRVDPSFRLSKHLNLHGKLGAGYSFNDENFIYKTGLWLSGDIKNNFSYNIGCLYSNTSTFSLGTTDYVYKECIADMEYTW